MSISVKNPALMDRLRIQALLRGIADQRGRDQMWNLLEQAVRAEGLRQQHYTEPAKDQQ